jgi:hypothetical protein
MKKLLRGLIGEARDLVDGRGRLTLSNLQYYENLKQSLDHFMKDDRYLLYFWDFRKYYPLSKPEETRDIIKRNWSSSDEVYQTLLTVSLEYGVSSGKREIYIRQHKESTQYLEIPDVLTPAELLIKEKKGHSGSREVLSWEHGTYSENKKIYYILGNRGMSSGQQNDVMGYVEIIDRFFSNLRS